MLDSWFPFNVCVLSLFSFDKKLVTPSTLAILKNPRLELLKILKGLYDMNRRYLKLLISHKQWPYSYLHFLQKEIQKKAEIKCDWLMHVGMFFKCNVMITLIELTILKYMRCLSKT